MSFLVCMLLVSISSERNISCLLSFPLDSDLLLILTQIKRNTPTTSVCPAPGCCLPVDLQVVERR